MNFDWSDEHCAFRARIREFMAARLPPNWEDLAGHGPASAEITELSSEFCVALAEEGLLFPHWPAEAGGQGLDPWYQQILAEEMWGSGEPRGGQYMNVNWIGPTLRRYGSDAQKARYLTPITEGRTLWCQGFSEPNSGSDLASLRTRAELEGDKYRINGQKIWTSYARLADTCFLLCRTSDDKKRGITILLVPMDTPGITVRQITQLDRGRRHPRVVLRRCRCAGGLPAGRGRPSLGDHHLFAEKPSVWESRARRWRGGHSIGP